MARKPMDRALTCATVSASLVTFAMLLGLMFWVFHPAPKMFATYAAGVNTGATATLPALDTPYLPPLSTVTPTMIPANNLPPDHNIPPFCATGGDPGTPTPTAVPGCSFCPFQFQPNTYTLDQAKAILVAAANDYHLPVELILALSHDESSWNPYIIGCSDDFGLMQIKVRPVTFWHSLDDASIPECGLTPTTYDPYTAEGNALLGAKLVASILCYFEFYGGHLGASRAMPGPNTTVWYYQQAHVNWPDLDLANGNPNPASLCATNYAAPAYKVLAPLTAAWSCPFTPMAGDATLLDIVISAYNQGISGVSQNGIQNWSYVRSIETQIADNP